MSNCGKRVKGIEAIVVAIRTLKLAEPTLTNKQIHARLSLCIHPCTVGVIVNNTSHRDPNYKPPLNHMTKNNWEKIAAKRPASIDCKHVCPTCGMGTETEAEALACCKRVKEA